MIGGGPSPLTFSQTNPWWVWSCNFLLTWIYTIAFLDSQLIVGRKSSNTSKYEWVIWSTGLILIYCLGQTILLKVLLIKQAMWAKPHIHSLLSIHHLPMLFFRLASFICIPTHRFLIIIFLHWVKTNFVKMWPNKMQHSMLFWQFWTINILH